VTTNDNLRALRFYQRRLRPLAVHRDAIARSRALKPSIPEVGVDGIPLRHELELELPLHRWASERFAVPAAVHPRLHHEEARLIERAAGR
jgi:hypothetical protein